MELFDQLYFARTLFITVAPAPRSALPSRTHLFLGQFTVFVRVHGREALLSHLQHTVPSFSPPSLTFPSSPMLRPS